MTLDSDRVQAIFLMAVEEKTPRDQPAVLDRKCAHEVELRLRVEAMRMAHDRPGGLLDRPNFAAGSEFTAILEHATLATSESRCLPDDREHQP
jgi:hypothetical protein